MKVKMVSYICSKSVFGFSRNETCTVYMSYITMGKVENGRVQRSSRKACKLYRSEKEERMKECRPGTHLAP